MKHISSHARWLLSLTSILALCGCAEAETFHDYWIADDLDSATLEWVQREMKRPVVPHVYSDEFLAWARLHTDHNDLTQPTLIGIDIPTKIDTVRVDTVGYALDTVDVGMSIWLSCCDSSGNSYIVRDPADYGVLWEIQRVSTLKITTDTTYFLTEEQLLMLRGVTK